MIPPDTAIIVSDEIDINKSAGLPGQHLFLCMNKEAYASCLEKGKKAIFLDEAIVEDVLAEMNDWAYRRTFDFVEKFRRGTKKYFLIESSFAVFKSIFVQFLQFIIVFDRILENKKIKKIYLYDDGISLFVPACREYMHLFKQGITVKVINKERIDSAHILFDFKQSLYSVVSWWTNLYYYFRILLEKTRGRIFFIASGSLKLLSGAIEKTQESKSHRIVFCENVFNFEKFKYCFKRGIFFIVIKFSSVENKLFKPEDWELAPRSVLYQGRDFSPIFNAVLARLFETGYFDAKIGFKLNFSFDDKKLLALFKRTGTEFVLLDEDVALRRIFLVLMNHLGKRSYVITHSLHGFPMRPSEDADEKRKYFSSYTFVNAPVDKKHYQRIYFDPAHLIVSGEPRYDKASRLLGAPDKRSGKKTILYCGSGLSDYDFACPILTVVGLKNFLEERTRLYFRDLLDILKSSKDVRLTIKPHYHEEEEWMRMLKAGAPESLEYQLHSHQEDILELIKDADVVVTPESTVIREAIMLKKPVVVLNYSKTELSLPNYEMDGLIQHVKNKEEFRKSLFQSLDDEGYLLQLSKARDKVYSEYAGILDGKNSERVAQCILNNRIAVKEPYFVQPVLEN